MGASQGLADEVAEEAPEEACGETCEGDDRSSEGEPSGLVPRQRGVPRLQSGLGRAVHVDEPASNLKAIAPDGPGPFDLNAIVAACIVFVVRVEVEEGEPVMALLFPLNE